MERYLGIFLIIAVSFLTGTVFPTNTVLGENIQSQAQQNNNPLPAYQPIETKSSFTQKLEEQTEITPKKIVFEDDPETEAGEEKIIQEGSDGKISKLIKIIYHKSANTPGVGFDSPGVSQDEEYSRELISQETTPAIDKKILRGTKIVWKTLDTPNGQITYWKKMRVYATHYDQHCNGCNEWTAIGMRAGKGIIAVDPKVIPMHSKVYIPGYGVAIAGDTGGAIKGNIIDLGFDAARTAGWSARFIDIYFL